MHEEAQLAVDLTAQSGQGDAAAQGLGQIIPLVKETFSEFGRHKSGWLAAAIAYFTLFAAAPLIIVIVEIAGFFLGRHRAALDALYGYMSQTAGPSAAGVIRTIVSATFAHPRTGILAQAIGWALLVVAAVGLFGSLQEALNTVWDVPAAKRTLVQTVKDRLLSFTAVLGVAFLLLVFLGADAVLTLATSALARIFPALPAMLKALEFALSFATITLLFALLFEYLPDCRVAWRDVWLGATVSAFLFVVGQLLLGWYLGRAGLASGYGSYGGLIVFLVWVYYSAQILLFGAEFTHVYARRHGSRS